MIGRRGGQATNTDTGSQPNQVSRRGGHIVIDGLTAQMHDGLPHHCVFPQGPCPGQTTLRTQPDNDPAVFHTRSLSGLGGVRRPRESVSVSERASEQPEGLPAGRHDARSVQSRPQGGSVTAGEAACGSWSLPVGRGAAVAGAAI
jgi:hypothetical protein